MRLSRQIREINEHNVQTLRNSSLQEIAGSLGDLGTLLPLMIALTVNHSINLSSTLVFSGLANIVAGAVFGVPLPVQPMKAIAAVAIGQHFTRDETAASGLVVSAAVFLLSAAGLLRWLNRVVPVPVVKGIQVGAGLSLAISAGTSFILPLGWAEPGYDNRLWAVAAFVLLLVAALLPRMPYALIVTMIAIIMAAVVTAFDSSSEGLHWSFWYPTTSVPSKQAFRTGAIEAAIPQLPLTTLNSILAVTSLSATLFPTFPPPPSTTSLGFSVAIANLIGCWFGAMPVCHGSGGLAGQYRFGARSGASIILLGLVKLVLGLVVGDAIVPLLQHFPKSLLGVMVLAAGVELAKVGQSVSESPDLWERAEEQSEDGSLTTKVRETNEQERKDRWMIMLITAAGCLAFKNDAVGFLAGLLWHWGLKVPALIGRASRHSGANRTQHQWAGAENGETARLAETRR